MMPIVTLTTDFGNRDWFVGSMKGAILRMCSRAILVDITHEIPRHDVQAAALTLFAACSCFPEGSIHLCVVDPGVGTSRRPVAVRTGTQYFVAPDNGVLSYVLENDVPFEAISLESWTPCPSATFHGRDIFGPVAGALAFGRTLSELGQSTDLKVRWSLPRPRWEGNACLGEILHVDQFGNLITNMGDKVRERVEEHLRVGGTLLWQVGTMEIRRLAKTYGEVNRGELVALWGSIDFFEIAAREARASDLTSLSSGDSVRLILLPIAPKKEV